MRSLCNASIGKQDGGLSDDEDDECMEVEDVKPTEEQRPSHISCYLATVDGELYGRCQSDGE